MKKFTLLKKKESPQFLADECVFVTTIRLLRGKGYKINSASEEKLLGISNGVLLKKAKVQKKILVTNDLDFSNILLYPLGSHSGIIILKITKKTEAQVHSVFLKLLEEISLPSIYGSLVVIDKNRYRVQHR